MVYKLGFSPTYENHTKVGFRIYVGLSVKHQVPKSLACGIHRDQQFWETPAESLRSMGLSMNVWRFVVTATLNPVALCNLGNSASVPGPMRSRCSSVWRSPRIRFRV